MEYSCGPAAHSPESSPEAAIQDTVLAQINALQVFLKDSFQRAVEEAAVDKRQLQHLFIQTRLLYKKFEWAAEYFTGSTTQMVNGPPVLEIEDADFLDPALVRPVQPSGLQVIEELLFPTYDSTQKALLRAQLQQLQSNLNVYTAYFNQYPMSDWRILDAARQEVFRILTLGITGYDAPLTLNSMAEAATSLRSLQGILSAYISQAADTLLSAKMQAATAYLQNHLDFDTFNRAVFITRYGNPIGRRITALSKNLQVPEVRYNRLLNQDAGTLFDTGAFNTNAFAPGPAAYPTPEKVALGKQLFHETALSGNGSRSCASCHQPAKAFTDGLAKHPAINGQGVIDRNAPTLINAALQSNLFYDMRALTLEDQIRDVVEDPQEMGGSLRQAVAYLSKHKSYRVRFAEAFPDRLPNPVDSFTVANAIAAYVRSLTGFNSRFDRYMRGDSSALTLQEVKGFNLFMGKAKCATCHFMPLFNGIAPPKYIASEAEVIGVPASLAEHTIDPDLGWYNTIGVEAYRHAFKTPTVRNITKTAPYMHNGVYATLEQVMAFYNKGGGAGLGLDLPNQTMSEDSLQLNDREMAAVIAFMKSLDNS